MAEFFSNLWNNLQNFFTERFHSIFIFCMVLIFGFILLKLILCLVHRSINRSRLKGAAGDFMTSLIKVLLYVIYVIALLALLGVPTTSMIALLSAFALAISLALQSTFSNVAAGFVLVTTKPFEEGDFIEVAGVSGSVETITILNTKLITTDNKQITLPNGTVMNGNIINYSAKETRRLDLLVSVAYGNDTAKVEELLLSVIARHGEFLQDPAPMVRLTDRGASSLDFTLRAWVLQKDYWPMYFAMNEEIYAALSEAGIEIPYQQLAVHIKEK